jgi:hypothetical protein
MAIIVVDLTRYISIFNCKQHNFRLLNVKMFKKKLRQEKLIPTHRSNQIMSIKRERER